MKQLFALFVLLHTASYGQQFTLAAPDIPTIEAKLELSGFPKEPVFTYLVQNYNPISKAQPLKWDDDFEDRPLCAMKMKFENGIEYYIDECGEGRGSTIVLSFPKAQIENVKQWIESIHQINSSANDNVWTGLEYHPSDGGAGCYYDIRENEHSTVVEIHCGC